MEENRVDVNETTEVIGTEDVNEVNLGVKDYLIVGGVMATGALIFELGKLGWKKTAKPRRKVAEFFSGLRKGKDKSGNTEEPVQEHEGSNEKEAESAETKGPEKKSTKK